MNVAELSSLSEGQERARLLELLTKKSFERRKITLASGRESNFYIDSKKTLLTSEGHWLVGRLLGAEVHRRVPNCEGVGGLTMGADPLASAVSLVSFFSPHRYNAFLVRKEAKGHGTGQWIEGLASLSGNAVVAILEDVVTTGASAWFAWEKAREAGLRPQAIIAVVDREEGGREDLESRGAPTYSLFRRSDFPL